MRRFVIGAVAAVAFILGTAGPALAHSCANANRPASLNPKAGGDGRWFYIPGEGADVWVFDMPNEGSLLEGSRHCTTGVAHADKVYWNWTVDSDPHGIVTGCGEAP